MQGEAVTYRKLAPPDGLEPPLDPAFPFPGAVALWRSFGTGTEDAAVRCRARFRTSGTVLAKVAAMWEYASTARLAPKRKAMNMIAMTTVTKTMHPVLPNRPHSGVGSPGWVGLQPCGTRPLSVPRPAGQGPDGHER